MSLKHLKKAVVLAACVGFLGWCFSQVAFDRPVGNRTRSGEPGLLREQLAEGARELPPAPFGPSGVTTHMDPQVRAASATTGGGLLVANASIGQAATFSMASVSPQDSTNPTPGKLETEPVKPIGAEEVLPSPGISGPKGPYVPFPEYTKPRPFLDGFNPSDHVETRMARLYYFRDAHRVAQIVNRDSQSYNRAAVDMQQQLADKSRLIADQTTDSRRAKERQAAEAAKATREAERDLKEAESQAVSAANQAAAAALDQQRTDAILRDSNLDDNRRSDAQATSDNLRKVIGRLEDVAAAARQKAAAARDKVQQLREKESQAAEQWQGALAVEERAREEQFRRELAATHADPDTYAPGQPGSDDPVRQVSVSVIGEGLIQLRGPIKGVNMIRTMINQIDSPVGQVRVNIHTVQINGDKGNRMERVAAKIQCYIDHSRFLTLQSAEMLRKAIVQVAAQKAMELGDTAGMTQEDRDQKYLYSFFGQDFIRELDAMDSEFLKTGNKLLSIHSMDSTSLASAMFLMGLAKNSTRLEILQVFEGMMAGELPMAEQNYLEAGLTCDGKHKLFSKDCKREDCQLLSQNARFQSIRGMFNAEIAADDIMTPIQREFVRLAQIFKSRLIVEMELRQRVMERAVIEERLGDREKELRDAKNKEDEAAKSLLQSELAKRDARKALLMVLNSLTAQSQATSQQTEEAKRNADRTSESLGLLLWQLISIDMQVSQRTGVPLKDLIAWLKKAKYTEEAKDIEETYEKARGDLLAVLDSKQASSDKVFSTRLRAVRRAVMTKLTEIEERVGEETLGYTPNNYTKVLGEAIVINASDSGQKFEIKISENNEISISESGVRVLDANLDEIVARGNDIQRLLGEFKFTADHRKKLDLANDLLKMIGQRRDNERLDNLLRANTMFRCFGSLIEPIAEKSGGITHQVQLIVASVSKEEANVGELFPRWLASERRYSDFAMDTARFAAGSDAFSKLVAADLDYQFSRRDAEMSRRPLDHKKLLDMLVDQMEDKYIELLEGTRAHTANIDAYIKRLMTSLDDDFNTQFYYPTFRKVREASQLWDVQMGQVETTNVLANNRGFAKVSPEATMEFDLPKRDVLINEAMNGAKAMIDDFGALTQDPTFLAMAQLGSGSPTSSQGGGASGGLSTVRNVLPGLSTDTAESVLGQQGPGGAKLGAAMEALIPDPAIYKFETGTGWEMRPVIQPDGQALVFHFTYLYTTNIREPVRADEKHLGRVKRHFVDTDVQLSNFELREISRYTVALKAARTAHGVPLFEDVPVVGVLFRPQRSAESSLQQNIILGQSTIFPTLFDLMGLRWAPVVADLDPRRLSNDEFLVRNRRQALMNRVFDHSSSQVDEFLRIPSAERRMDLYRSQETIPTLHPNGYQDPGARWDRPAPGRVFPTRDTGIVPTQFEQEMRPNSDRAADGRPTAAADETPRDTRPGVMKRLPAVSR